MAFVALKGLGEGFFLRLFVFFVAVYPNRQGKRDEFAERPPFPLECQNGIAVIPEDDERDEPRLPVFGLRAVR